MIKSLYHEIDSSDGSIAVVYIFDFGKLLHWRKVMAEVKVVVCELMIL
ncbi:MAG: hypothetical protein ACMUEM_01875 [Flavobacteriales bacterium AspAUS03]